MLAAAAALRQHDRPYRPMPNCGYSIKRQIFKTLTVSALKLALHFNNSFHKYDPTGQTDSRNQKYGRLFFPF